MYVSPAAAQSKATMRMIAATFLAGAGAMLFLGVVVPVMAKGAVLSVRAAEASVVQRSAPPIEPLDVDAVRAQLAEADAVMRAARATTNDDIARLARLTPRR